MVIEKEFVCALGSRGEIGFYHLLNICYIMVNIHILSLCSQGGKKEKTNRVLAPKGSCFHQDLKCFVFLLAFNSHKLSHTNNRNIFSIQKVMSTILNMHFKWPNAPLPCSFTHNSTMPPWLGDLTCILANCTSWRITGFRGGQRICDGANRNTEHLNCCLFMHSLQQSTARHQLSA